MDNVNITKGGLRQTVSLLAFEKLYQPNGWVVDDTETPINEVQETVKSLKDEMEVKNYLAMRKRQPKKFNDGLFKSETQ